MANKSLLQNIQQVKSDFDSIKVSLINKGCHNFDNGAIVPTKNYSTIIDGLSYNTTTINQWLSYINSQNTYTTIQDVLNSNDYNLILNNEKASAFAAFIADDIAAAIKADGVALAKALKSTYKYMFIESSKGFDDDLVSLCDQNEGVTSETYEGIVSCSSERGAEGYHCYMAFDKLMDPNKTNLNLPDFHKTFGYRNVWSAVGENQWLQYNYYDNNDEPVQKLIYAVDIYAIRDNAPKSVKIEGCVSTKINNEWVDGDFETIIEKELSGEIGIDKYTRVKCMCDKKYNKFRFTISENIIPSTCAVGEIVIWTWKE